MSLIVVHLRWDDVDPGQYEHLCRTVLDGPDRPAGRLHRRHERHGGVVLATEVWIDEERAGAHLAGLPELLGAAGLGEPQSAAFALPDCFAAGYGVFPARMRTATAAEPLVPAPRVSDEARLPSADGGSLAPAT